MGGQSGSKQSTSAIITNPQLASEMASHYLSVMEKALLRRELEGDHGNDSASSFGMYRALWTLIVRVSSVVREHGAKEQQVGLLGYKILCEASGPFRLKRGQDFLKTLPPDQVNKVLETILEFYKLMEEKNKEEVPKLQSFMSTAVNGFSGFYDTSLNKVTSFVQSTFKSNSATVSKAQKLSTLAAPIVPLLKDKLGGKLGSYSTSLTSSFLTLAGIISFAKQAGGIFKGTPG